MPTSMIIVDDFMDDPYSLRKTALSLNYPEGSGPFPGRNSKMRIDVTGMDEQVSRLVGEPFEASRHHKRTPNAEYHWQKTKVEQKYMLTRPTGQGFSI